MRRIDDFLDDHQRLDNFITDHYLLCDLILVVVCIMTTIGVIFAMSQRMIDQEPITQRQDMISDAVQTRPGVDDSDISIGDLVIYGDGFETTASFMEAAVIARNAWLLYGEAYTNGRASFGKDYSWDFQRSGSYLIRNAQRTVKPCEEDAKFVRRLSDNTYRLKRYRIIVLSPSKFEPKTVEGIGFYPIPEVIDYDKTIDDLMLWYRIGAWEEEI